MGITACRTLDLRCCDLGPFLQITASPHI
uniref:Uncharacterized protein n=1 Tax=Arundo donax TaxID=35708 RepID=A0A0A9G041_ARUDO